MNTQHPNQPGSPDRGVPNSPLPPQQFRAGNLPHRPPQHQAPEQFAAQRPQGQRSPNQQNVSQQTVSQQSLSQQGLNQPTPNGPAGNKAGDLPNLNIRERRAFSINGFLALLILLAVLLLGLWLAINGIVNSDSYTEEPGPSFIPGALLAGVAFILMFNCLTIVAPGTAKVVQFFGSYAGSIRAQGLRLTIPFSTRRTVSVKVRNFETNVLKVNDADGNPINIAAIIVWRVTDTAKAVFAVENFEEFVETQAEAALRHVTGYFPYDSSDPNQVTLLDSTAEVSDRIASEVASRINIAGLEVVEARISALSYAPEIAPAMLQRQQAAAVIAARERIVQGAVSIVQDALKQLEGDSETTISEERRVDIISNMLVVLTSETRVTPVINASSASVSRHDY